MSGRAASEFEAHRPYLQGLAYRLLGSMTEAEDAVQDAFLRYSEQADDGPDNPRAWLARVVTNRCIDMLRATKSRREVYVGEWLPEPVATDESGRPELAAERADGLSLAFLALLERLTPDERAAYLLHDIFDWNHAEVAACLDKSETACRQLVSRARKHIADGRPRFAAPGDAKARDDTVARFVAAMQAGDAAALMDILSDDAILINDGGGKAKAALNPIYGSEKIARFLLSIAGKLPKGLVWESHEINGQPGFVGRFVDGKPYAVMTYDVADERVHGIQAIVNPDKLTAFARAAPAGETA